MGRKFKGQTTRTCAGKNPFTVMVTYASNCAPLLRINRGYAAIFKSFTLEIIILSSVSTGRGQRVSGENPAD